MTNFKEEEFDDTSGNDDLYEHFRFVADKGQNPLRRWAFCRWTDHTWPGGSPNRQYRGHFSKSARN